MGRLSFKELESLKQQKEKWLGREEGNDSVRAGGAVRADLESLKQQKFSLGDPPELPTRPELKTRALRVGRTLCLQVLPKVEVVGLHEEARSCLYDVCQQVPNCDQEDSDSKWLSCRSLLQCGLGTAIEGLLWRRSP